MTDDEGLVLDVLTTTASKNEIANLEEVLETVNVALPKDIPLKAYKNKLLTRWEKKFNKLIGKIQSRTNIWRDKKMV